MSTTESPVSINYNTVLDQLFECIVNSLEKTLLFEEEKKNTSISPLILSNYSNLYRHIFLLKESSPSSPSSPGKVVLELTKNYLHAMMHSSSSSSSSSSSCCCENEMIISEDRFHVFDVILQETAEILSIYHTTLHSNSSTKQNFNQFEELLAGIIHLLHEIYFKKRYSIMNILVSQNQNVVVQQQQQQHQQQHQQQQKQLTDVSDENSIIFAQISEFDMILLQYLELHNINETIAHTNHLASSFKMIKQDILLSAKNCLIFLDCFVKNYSSNDSDISHFLYEIANQNANFLSIFSFVSRVISSPLMVIRFLFL